METRSRRRPSPCGNRDCARLWISTSLVGVGVHGSGDRGPRLRQGVGLAPVAAGRFVGGDRAVTRTRPDAPCASPTPRLRPTFVGTHARPTTQSPDRLIVRPSARPTVRIDIPFPAGHTPQTPPATPPYSAGVKP